MLTHVTLMIQFVMGDEDNKKNECTQDYWQKFGTLDFSNITET